MAAMHFKRCRTANHQGLFAQALWRAAGEAAKHGDIVKALLLFEAGRVA